MCCSGHVRHPHDGRHALRNDHVCCGVQRLCERVRIRYTPHITQPTQAHARTCSPQPALPASFASPGRPALLSRHNPMPPPPFLSHTHTPPPPPPHQLLSLGHRLLFRLPFLHISQTRLSQLQRVASWGLGLEVRVFGVWGLGITCEALTGGSALGAADEASRPSSSEAAAAAAAAAAGAVRVDAGAEEGRLVVVVEVDLAEEGRCCCCCC
jgi:hypothetical protein